MEIEIFPMQKEDESYGYLAFCGHTFDLKCHICLGKHISEDIILPALHHEIMHAILYDIIGKDESKQYDNVVKIVDNYVNFDNRQQLDKCVRIVKKYNLF